MTPRTGSLRGVPTRYGPCVNDVLSPVGRMVRVVVTVIAGALLLAGTVWGTDDHFPFGPFSMYAGVNPPNEPAPDTRVEGVEPDDRPVDGRDGGVMASVTRAVSRWLFEAVPKGRIAAFRTLVYLFVAGDV